MPELGRERGGCLGFWRLPAVGVCVKMEVWFVWVLMEEERGERKRLLV